MTTLWIIPAQLLALAFWLPLCKAGKRGDRQ